MNQFKESILLLIAICTIGITDANAQNLIADPGFEIWDGTIGLNPNTLGGLTHWYNANGTSDHHHVDNNPGTNLTGLENCPLGEGNTWCGVAYEGDGVLGCWKGNGPDGTREWAGIELTEPMVAGGCYEISFWIQNKKDRPGSELVSNQWGMFFNHTPTPTFNADLANYAAMSDHWVACEEVIEGSEWIKVEFDYQASEDFAYAYIGYMGDFSTSTYYVYNDSYQLGYYVWIDEVIITRIDPQLTLSEDITICPGESVILEADSNFPIIWQDNNSSATQRTETPTQTTTYIVQTQDSTLCTQIDSIVVTLVEEEVISFAGASICDQADPLILAPTAAPGTWTGPGIIDATEGLFDPSLTGVGNFLVNYISDADCSENYTMEVTVDAPPPVDFEADQFQGCPPIEVQFSNLSPEQGIAYNWDFGNGASSNDSTATSSFYSELGSYDVSLEVVFSENCSNSQTITDLIEVFEPPTADFTFAPMVPSNFDPLVDFTNTSSGDIVTWFWDFGNGQTSEKINAQANYNLPGRYDVTLYVASANGCADSISQQVLVNSLINFYAPNVFSPNDDGVNDEFQVNSYGPLVDFKMQIFDRWGGIVFQSENINTGWDGELPDGQKGNKGVYIYAIEYSYQGIENNSLISNKLMGDILLMR